MWRGKSYDFTNNRDVMRNHDAFVIGKRIVKMVPLSLSLCTETVPECASTIIFTRSNPNPTPFAVEGAASARVNGSKIWGRISGEINDPVFENRKTTESSSCI